MKKVILSIITSLAFAAKHDDVLHFAYELTRHGARAPNVQNGIGDEGFGVSSG